MTTKIDEFIHGKWGQHCQIYTDGSRDDNKGGVRMAFCIPELRNLGLFSFVAIVTAKLMGILLALTWIRGARPIINHNQKGSLGN